METGRVGFSQTLSVSVLPSRKSGYPRPIEAGSPPVVQGHQDRPKSRLVESVTHGVRSRPLAQLQTVVAILPGTETFRGEGAGHPGPEHRLPDHRVVLKGQEAASGFFEAGQETGLHVQVAQRWRGHVPRHEVVVGNDVHAFVQSVVQHHGDVPGEEAGGGVHPDGHLGVMGVGLERGRSLHFVAKASAQFFITELGSDYKSLSTRIMTIELKSRKSRPRKRMV